MDELTCERCGAAFGCGAREGGCWCDDVTLTDESRRGLAAAYPTCLCPRCLRQAATPGTRIGFLDARPDEHGTLLRALRSDVPFGFVEIAPGEGPYEVVHADGDPDGRGGVLLVTRFEVPTGSDDRFLAAFAEQRETHARRRGYLGTRLHRGPAPPRFVAVTRWSSPLMYARCLQQPQPAMPFRAHPAIYQRLAPATT